MILHLSHPRRPSKISGLIGLFGTNMPQQTQHGLETNCQEFKTQLAAEEAQSRIEGGGIAGTSTIVVKPLQFDASTSGTVVSLPVWACGWLQQLGSLWDGHTSTWNYAGIIFQLLTQCSTWSDNKDIVEASKGHYGDHHLVVAYWSQLKARTVQQCMVKE